MKVLQVTPAFYPAHVYGGPIQSIYQLCRHLACAGTQVCVLTTDANGIDKLLDVEKRHEVEFEQNLRVRYCRRRLRNAVSPSLIGLLPKYIQWADVVHLRGVYSFPTIPTLFFCKLLGKPVVWTPHGAFQQWEGMKRRGAKAVWESICRIVAPSKLAIHTASEQEAQTAINRFPGAEVVVIPHGIEIPQQLPQEEHKQDEVLRLLYVGRLHPIKGIELLLDACKILSLEFRKPWSLTVAGVGAPDYTRLLENRISDLGLWHEVKLVGEVVGEAKQDLFANIDVVVVPSLTESFSLVVAEALAHGVPVIASSGTPWSRLEQMECGLWVHNDPESLAKAIRRMSALPIQKMGNNGREWMHKEFTWQNRTQQMLGCYQRVMV